MLQVKPVPEFLRAVIPTAAYQPPAAFAKAQRGVFWVNDLSLTKQTAAEKLAEQQQHFGLPLTCAHEAYPGHHLQFVTANHHPRKWRRLFAHAVFYEGWTLWCEQMLVDLRIDRSPWLPVQQLHDALWRCHRILVDLRLQTGRYSYEQAVRHLQRHVGFTRARADSRRELVHRPARGADELLAGPAGKRAAAPAPDDRPRLEPAQVQRLAAELRDHSPGVD